MVASGFCWFVGRGGLLLSGAFPGPLRWFGSFTCYGLEIFYALRRSFTRMVMRVLGLLS